MEVKNRIHHEIGNNGIRQKRMIMARYGFLTFQVSVFRMILSLILMRIFFDKLWGHYCNLSMSDDAL